MVTTHWLPECLAAALWAACSAGCVVPHRPAELPARGDAWVAVLSGEMPDAIQQVARHAWIVASVPGESRFRRWELLGRPERSSTGDPFRYFGEGDVAVHGIVRMDTSSLLRIARCLDEEVVRYDERHPTYFPIPGPNSNTFVAEALRNCSIHVELPATAIGRDYRGVLGAGVTEAGTGVQIESWIAGLRLGLREGVEVHVASLALGVHVWPPGITVPVNPGRIGIDLDGRANDEQLGHRRGDDSDDGWEGKRVRDRKYGLGAAQMFARGARVAHPEDAGGLAERWTVGLSGRALYGTRLGWGFGGDLELGAGAPASFAWAAHLYPAGLGYMIGPTGYIGAFAGVGGSGVTGKVPNALDLPMELRLELDGGTRTRFGFRAAAIWIPFESVRQGGSVLPFADELVLGTFVRVGKTRLRYGDAMGKGWFLGLDRHEVMGSFWLGLTWGVEADFGG